MSNWKETTWGTITTLEYGKPVNYKQPDGTVPVYGTNGQIGFTKSEPLCKFPSVIIGRKGAYRGVHFSAVPFCLIDTGFFLKPISKNIIDIKFAYYNLLNTDINRLDSGSAIPSTSRPDFYQIDLLLPQLAEQKRIADVLTCLDVRIENLRRQNETLEAIAKTLFKHWFIDFEFPNADGKPYKSSGGGMWRSEIGDIPEGWQAGELEDIADISIGRTPPRKEPEWFSTNSKDVKWISIRDMGNCGIYILDTFEYLTLEAIEKFNVPVIPENTVIVSFKLTVGRLAITTETMLSNEAIAHIKLIDKFLNAEYIYLFLKQYNFDQLGSTSSIATAVNSKSIKSISILLPCSEMIDYFYQRVSPNFKKIRLNTQQIQTLTKTRDALLPKLMSGQLRVEE